MLFRKPVVSSAAFQLLRPASDMQLGPRSHGASVDDRLVRFRTMSRFCLSRASLLAHLL
jgi:hypothetical protein